MEVAARAAVPLPVGVAAAALSDEIAAGVAAEAIHGRHDGAEARPDLVLAIVALDRVIDAADDLAIGIAVPRATAHAFAYVPSMSCCSSLIFLAVFRPRSAAVVR